MGTIQRNRGRSALLIRVTTTTPPTIIPLTVPANIPLVPLTTTALSTLSQKELEQEQEYPQGSH
jgi:hypothetical protein